MTVAEAILDEVGAVVGAAGVSGDTSDNDEAALIAAIGPYVLAQYRKHPEWRDVMTSADLAS
jgi:hypothetical protein